MSPTTAAARVSVNIGTTFGPGYEVVHKDGLPPRNPLPGLRDGRRAIYRRVITVSNDRVDDEDALYGALAFKDQDRTATLMEALHQVLDQELDRTVERGDILLDVPFRPREGLAHPVWIYSGRRPGRPMELAQSPVVSSLKSEFDTHVKKCRVFLHPEVLTELGTRLDAVRPKLLTTLKASCGL